jgi:hypothetical protein
VSSPQFEISVAYGVVVITLHGDLDYEEVNQAIAAGVKTAGASHSLGMLFDLRSADVANYYSYSVRHAETAPQLGLDTSFALAFVGTGESRDVLSFMETVARNRGWRARAFTAMPPALKWLSHGDARIRERLA